MLEIVLPVAVLWMLLLFVAQLRRLITDALLFRTIKRALEVEPASARLLIEKVEARPRYPDALGGWTLVVAAVALGLGSLFAQADDRVQMVQIAVISGVIGCGVLTYAWWVDRSARSLHSAPPTAD